MRYSNCRRQQRNSPNAGFLRLKYQKARRFLFGGAVRNLHRRRSRKIIKRTRLIDGSGSNVRHWWNKMSCERMSNPVRLYSDAVSQRVTVFKEAYLLLNKGTLPSFLFCEGLAVSCTFLLVDFSWFKMFFCFFSELHSWNGVKPSCFLQQKLKKNKKIL